MENFEVEWELKMEKGNLNFFGFLDQKDQFAFYVRKTDSYYHVHLVELLKGKIHQLKEFKTKQFLSSYKYLQLSEEMKKFFFQNSLTSIQCFDSSSLEETPLLFLQDEMPIHEFLVFGEYLYTVSNDFHQEDKNKSIIKIYRFSDVLKRICKRSFKNVQELKMLHNADFSLFMVLAHQFQDKTGSSYYGREKIF